MRPNLCRELRIRPIGTECGTRNAERTDPAYRIPETDSDLLLGKVDRDRPGRISHDSR